METMGVKTAVITGYGINADYELEEAFLQAGSEADRIHINDLIREKERLKLYQILAFPGGFSFGDHISSGLVFANLCRKHLLNTFYDFIDKGKLIIGICNGFQVLVKMGILPNAGKKWEQEVSLVHNDSGEFIDTWVRVEVNKSNTSLWTKGVQSIELPIRHGEGKFIVKNEAVLRFLTEKRCVALTYAENNPNGSVHNIAGITDVSGRIFGLMPHPEAYLLPQNHPGWPRDRRNDQSGLVFFKNAVQFVKKNLII